MIREQDLQEAIAECKGKRNPDANTCIKLAAFLTIQRELFGNVDNVTYSYDPPVVEDFIDYYSDTEFGQYIEGKQQSKVLPVIDELMTTLKVIQPRLYESAMRKLKD